MTKRKKHAGGRPTDDKLNVSIMIRVTDEQRARFYECAQLAGDTSVTAWIRRMLELAARKEERKA